ncbi:hypothetical protein [Actinocorallia sp. A-T 12471]|uniref:DUF7064 domain-containing protein n=1 Tax=Actinocorallia sp. A-T 12471 TaxID=3089813 RepID=UPI0029D26941|nr:hypothetical protein [Actinocorallia sp. A-T 12471]MDX6743541.1 hypothetical protein [Actinocorallia sp. A-T 12471]
MAADGAGEKRSRSSGAIAPGVRLRLDPEDEGMHELGPEEHFNESMYFNFFDPVERIGGWVRLGNRANQGYAERTVCLYLPDGEIAFDYARPAIADNARFAAGGMAFEVREPFRELAVSFEGEVIRLADGFVMADPKTAYATSPRAKATVDLTVEGVSPMLGGEAVAEDGGPLPETHGGDFARGHYEQHIVSTGSVRVGDREWRVRAPGLRDHSWGPRHWQSPWWYRWLTGNFGRDAGFVASVIARRDGSRTVGGVVFREGRYEQIHDVRLRTVWHEQNATQTALSLTLATDEGSYEVEGSVLSMVPLRNRRTDADGSPLTTRIAEGLTEWRCPALAEQPGGGMSEYLDQIIDGAPVGRAEEDR